MEIKKSQNYFMKIEFKKNMLVGTVLTITLLGLWKIFNPYNCLAWLFPIFVTLIIGYGQFEFLMIRRRCEVNCMLKPGSWMYKLLTGKSLVLVITILSTCVVSIPLISFIALAGIIDILFVLLSLLITAILFGYINKISSKHLNSEIKIAVIKRIDIVISLIIMVLIYSVLSIYFIPLPSYLDTGSFQETLNVASQEVASVCPSINFFLKIAIEVEAALFYGLVFGSSSTNFNGYSGVFWVLFFVNNAFVFSGLARLQLELSTMSGKLLDMISEKKN